MNVSVRTNTRVAEAARGGVAKSLFFFFNDTATTEIYTLSLHDALPICPLSSFQTRAGVARRPQVDISEAWLANTCRVACGTGASGVAPAPSALARPALA